MKYNAILLAASAAVAVAQVVFNETTQTFTCPANLPDGSFCAGDSLQSNIIIRCSAGVGTPGNCNDNLAGFPPVGVNFAPCYETAPGAGDAECSKNCIVRPIRGGEFPAPGCTPTSSSSAAPSSSAVSSSAPSTSASSGSRTSSSSRPITSSSARTTSAATSVISRNTTIITTNSNTTRITTQTRVNQNSTITTAITTVVPINPTTATRVTNVPVGPTTTAIQANDAVAYVYSPGAFLAGLGFAAIAFF